MVSICEKVQGLCNRGGNGSDLDRILIVSISKVDKL